MRHDSRRRRCRRARRDDAQVEVPSVAGAKVATGPTTTTVTSSPTSHDGRGGAPAPQLVTAREAHPRHLLVPEERAGDHLRGRRARLRSVEVHRVGADHDVDRAAAPRGRSAARRARTRRCRCRRRRRAPRPRRGTRPSSASPDAGRPPRACPIARPDPRASPRPRRRATAPPAGRGSRAARCASAARRISTTCSRRVTRRPVSSDANGSSSRITSGAGASARASATRCRSPPESSCG